MKPGKGARLRGARFGALALTLGVALVAPGAAHADGATTLTRFQLPSAADVDKLNDMGVDLTENVIPGPNGSVYADAVVDASEKAQLQALGYQPTMTLFDEQMAQDNAAARNQALQQEKDAFANLAAGKAVDKAQGSSIAADTVQASRADYFENYAGRFVSIEGWTSDGTTNGNSYSGPALTASWLDAGGTTLGSGNLSAFVDDGKYLYSRNLFRVGNVGDGGMPASIRIASANGGVDTLAVKQWVSKDGSGQFPNGFLKDFTTHYVDPQEAYAKITSLAAEFPTISSVVSLPNQTPGYQRQSQAIVGTATAYDPLMSSLTSAGSVSAADQAKAVVVTSAKMGQSGGNAQSIELDDPHAASQPLTVSITGGTTVVVKLATDAGGAITSTAAQVVNAINSSSAHILMTAGTYRTNSGAGVVSATANTKLSDFLKAPTTYPRGPQTVKMLKIGKDQSDGKTGVFIYCQEHAREWVTPLVCLETAERLLRNYGTDPETTSLVDNLDIYIVPVINADGAAYSMYDYNSQRKNMVDYCTSPGNTDPTSRNSWGVDLNRNFSVGSLFDGYSGGGSSCTGETFSGPFELSEPEVQNETYIQSTYTNIKFAMNIHSYGGYFMWPPGAYKTANRETLPYPSYGTQAYFQQTADSVLDRIKSYRGTAILPARTGPVADVLYSAAGNSADEAYYNHNIIGYDFEVGADRFSSTTTGTGQSPVNFQPPYGTPGAGQNQSLVNEGHDEAMEFANGNYSLLDAALAYEKDATAPTVTPVGPDTSPTPFSVTLSSDEAADIHYTTDGSTPTTDSPVYQPPRPRALPTPIPIDSTTTLRWIATDFKGNTSTGSKTFTIGTQEEGGTSGDVPATLTLSLGAAPTFGAFAVGVDMSYDASSTATVLSTAGDAALSISDSDAAHPGHLVNGTFSLADAVQAMGASAGGASTGIGAVGGSPRTLETWDGPISNDAVTLSYKQHIGGGEALRTGNYSKTFVYTLSTTTP